MTKKAVVFLIIAMVAPVFSSHANETVQFTRTAHITFKSLSRESGLSNGSIYTIDQDSRGVMWFGTDDMLNMYDGTRFTHFGHDPENTNSIASNSASNIFVDRDDNIWIGTWGGGLDKYDPALKQFTHYKNDPDDINSLSDNRVQTIFQDASGTLWVGTYSGGLNKLDETTGEFTRYMNNPGDPSTISNNRIWGMTEVDDGNLIIATSDGLNYFDVKDNSFESYKHDPEQPDTIASSATRVVHKGVDGDIWVGTNSGISLFDTQSRTFENFQPNLTKFDMKYSTVNALLLDDETGVLWVGGYHGLLEFDTKRKIFVNRHHHSENDLSSLAFDHVTALHQDSSGLIWIGTRGGGVSTFAPNIVFSYLESNRDNASIRPLMLDAAGSLWIESSHELFRYSPSNEQTQLISFEEPDSIPNALTEDNQGNIFVGFSKGKVYKYEHSTHRSKEVTVPFVNNQIFINEILADGDELWISTYRGNLYLMDMISETLESVYTHDKDDPSSIGGNEVESMFKDSEGRLWFGTENGISLFHRETQTFTSYSMNFVYSMHEDTHGRLWLGSRDGLYSLDFDSLSDYENNTVGIKNYDKEDGLPSNIVYGVQVDGTGNVWASTDYGISKFDPFNSRFVNYNKKNGLKMDAFGPNFSDISPEGEIYFGTVSFFPENIQENTTAPNVIITEIVVNGNPLEFDQSTDRVETLNLTHTDILFSFEFSALDFVDSGSNQYAYMLDGFDSDWVYGKNRNYARYTNINPGVYRFRVKASNSDGYWNEKGAAIEIVITPPWWDTVTTKLLALITIILLLTIGYFIRIANLRRLNATLKTKVDEKTRELSVLNEKLLELASTDALTQLTNRRCADIHLETEWKRAQRIQVELSVIMLDIDYFKGYNDLYGHLKGDECLRTFANLLNTVAKRSSDIACRYGGEEFLMILPNTPREGAVVIAESIQKELKALELPHERSKVSEFLTCSIGVATVIPTDGQKISDLIQSADDALYKAKKQGRNTIIGCEVT